jgi:Fe2+ transport system protein B
MVSNKIIAILIILSVLLLVFSLVISMSLPNSEAIEEQEVPNGNPEASIGLIINPSANGGASAG